MKRFALVILTDTIRVMRLYRWKNNTARRTAIVATFPLLFAANIVLATIGWVLFGIMNQRELLRTSKHYWNSSERIDAPNALNNLRAEG